jgi:hypothetical protein
MRYLVAALTAFVAFAPPIEPALLAAAPAQRHINIPADLPGAAEFVGVLQHAGVAVREVTYSMVGSLFRDTAEQGAFIRTNLGVVEVAFFKREMDAERVTVTYSKTTDNRIMHHYVIGGMPTNGQGGTWFSAYPIYITLHHHWFIETMYPQLDGIIKQALGQRAPFADGRTP